jgi:DNA-binding IclR family transcriptional regulator
MSRKTAKRKYDAPAARMVIRLIEELCQNEEPLGVTELVQRLQSNSNMVFRLLYTLEEMGWIVRNGGATPKYSIGLRPFHYTSKPVRRTNVRQAAEGPLRELHQTTRQSCYLGIIDGTRTFMAEHLDALEGDVRLNAQPGGRHLMHCAAPGKVLLAFSPESFVDKVIKVEGLFPQTDHTITAAPKLKKELARIRSQGYAVDREEFARGLICFAAPLFNVSNELAGTIGISVLTLYYSLTQLEKEIGPAVMMAADRTSEALGATRRCFLNTSEKTDNKEK